MTSSETVVTRNDGFTAWDLQSTTDSDLTGVSMGAPWRYSRTSMLGQEGSDMDYDDDKTTLINSPALCSTYTKPMCHLQAFKVGINVENSYLFY